MRILLTVTGPVPRWATNGAKDNVTRPSPNEFQKFMQAVGRHYGDRVDAFSIWNEPNQPQFLGPQFDARHRPASPSVYRGLVFAAQRGLQRVGMGAKPLLLGETSPQGTGKVVAPLTFLRGHAVPGRALPARQGLRAPGRRRLRPPRLHDQGRPALPPAQPERRDDRRAPAAHPCAGPRGRRRGHPAPAARST